MRTSLRRIAYALATAALLATTVFAGTSNWPHG